MPKFEKRKMRSYSEDEIPNSTSMKKHQTSIEVNGDDEVDDSPIEEVRLTVPLTDDPSLTALTSRTWILGILSCCLLAFVNQFFSYRQNHLHVGAISAQILVLPVGKLLAATLPSKQIHLPFTKWSFSLNPGPFNLKEHVLITIFASCGAGDVSAVGLITIVKVFYHRSLNPAAATLLVQTTQLLGYGWAGLFRKYLVDSPYMWWPSQLVQVSLFRALHEEEKRTRGGLTRLQFFLVVFTSSFAYYVVPGYLFPSLSALSFVCWIWKDSITAQKLGSGLQGIGIGSFGLDWSTVAGFLGSPLATPFFVIANILVGLFLFLYVLIPIAYWCNAYEAMRFPLLSPHTFDSTGQVYNITRVLNEKAFDLDIVDYDKYSKLYLSIMFAFVYGLSFAFLMASLSHVALFHGKTIWQLWRRTTTADKDQFGDVHTRLMKKNYEAVPQWWFHAILILALAISFYACEGFDKQLQLPWWGLLLACGMALFFTLPFGVIKATTNMGPSLNVISELIIGYMYPGKPLANATFKIYSTISMQQALGFLSDFKLGHYMKVPPKSMFIAQLAGTVVASTVHFGTAWWLLTSVENICNTALLPEGSQWTCPSQDVAYNISIIWGVVGPLRMFTKNGIYPEMNWFFLIGLLAPVPVWLLARKYPEKKWIKYIHVPMILEGPLHMPSAKVVHYMSWGAVGVFFNYYVYRRFKEWWARHTYILSAALDAGVAFMGVFLFFALQSGNINGPEWWGLENSDHCPLAKCPTAPGINVKGCPVL